MFYRFGCSVGVFQALTIAFIVVILYGSEFTMPSDAKACLFKLLRLHELGPTRLGSGGMAITLFSNDLHDYLMIALPFSVHPCSLSF